MKRTNSPPQLVCLSPYRTTDVEGLLVNQLPFSEDFRLFSFPPLPETPLDAEDEYSTEGAGTQGVTHAQMAAAGSLIDALMLPSTTTGGETKEEGDGGDGGDGGGKGPGPDYLVPEHTYNPTLQRFYQCLKARVMEPNCALPPAAESIDAILRPHKVGY